MDKLKAVHTLQWVALFVLALFCFVLFMPKVDYWFQQVMNWF